MAHMDQTLQDVLKKAATLQTIVRHADLHDGLGGRTVEDTLEKIVEIGLKAGKSLFRVPLEQKGQVVLNEQGRLEGFYPPTFTNGQAIEEPGWYDIKLAECAPKMKNG